MANYRFTKTIFSDRNELLIAKLRELRVKAGLTQEKASKRLGCKQTFLSKIECGERRLDVLEFAFICCTYGFQPGRIIDELLKGSKPQIKMPRKK